MSKLIRIVDGIGAMFGIHSLGTILESENPRTPKMIPKPVQPKSEREAALAAAQAKRDRKAEKRRQAEKKNGG